MSAPAFAWALEQGAEHKLPPAERLVLIYLSDMANGIRVCWPGQERIVRFTGLALRTVRSAIHSLARRQLIRVEATPGIVTKYHILRPDTPANGAWVGGSHPGNMSQGTPANGNGAPRQNVPHHPGKWRKEPRQNPTATPANRPPDPSKTQERDPRARAPAREEVSRDLNSGKKQEDAAPQPAAATQSGDDFNAFLEAPTPAKALPAEIEQEVVRADVPDPDAPVGAEVATAVLQALRHELRMRAYPPRAATMDREDQIAATLGPRRDKPQYLANEQLAAARRVAGIGIAHA